MRLLFVIALSLVTFSISFAQSNSTVSLEEYVSLQSVNYPNKYIRHYQFLGKITQVRSGLDRKDASFRVVPALNGQEGYVSLESVNYPGYYLRHEKFILHLHQQQSSQLYKNDASFRVVEGLAGSGVSFESANYPNYYIRHYGFELKLNESDGSRLFKKDASFIPKDAFSN